MRSLPLLLLAACSLVPKADRDPDGDGLTWTDDCDPWDADRGEDCSPTGADSDAGDDTGAGDSGADDSAVIDDSGADDSGADDSAVIDDSGVVDADGDGSPADEDCDDANPDRYPGAPELCDDGVVNDCAAPRGWEDAVCVELSGRLTLPDQASLVIEGDAAGDRLGLVVAGLGDRDADGRDELGVASQEYDDRDGVAATYYGDLGGNRDLDDAHGRLNPEYYVDRLGVSMVSVGDLNGDGLADLAVGVRYGTGRVADTGAAYLFYGGGPSGEVLVTTADASLVGTSPSDFVGEAIAAAGDVNGTGAGILVSAPSQNGGETLSNAGRVYLIVGAPYGQVELALTSDALHGHESGGQLGDTLAGLGDVDGDGLDDFIAGGSTYNRTSGRYTGQAYLWTGGLSGAASADDAEATVTTATEVSGPAAPALAGPGDVDGDGYADVLIGCSDCNRAAVFHGPFSGGLSISQGELSLLGEASSEAGTAVAGVPDLTGDGRPDLLLGAPGYGSGAGRAYVVSGAATGSVSLASAALILDSAVAGAELGASVAHAGDADGNGAPDLLLGAPGVEDDKGAAWLVLGAP